MGNFYSSKQAVCNWEHGRREPSLELVQEMANVFKCSIDDLLKDSENIN
ncbi:helix-turn-helix transcriptional regulator [Lactococcus lactis]|nr:helix-turn-helix transcriptional regulator [Lactococcus lactis]